VEISIVIPVYNSERIVPELTKQLVDVLSGMLFEVILVNDYSSDNSWGVISNICQKYEQVKGVCLSKNFGQDNAIMAGLGQAEGDYIVIMDDDLQHSPHDIPDLYKTIKERACEVCYADYSGDKKQSLWKNLGSFLNSKQAEILLNKPHDVYLSPFKIIKRNVLKSILDYDGPYPYVDGLIARSTRSITQVKVIHQKRYDGNSNYTIIKSFSVFFKHLTGFSVVPLRIASFVGISSSIIGFVLGVYYIIGYFSGNNPEGWTTLVALQLFVGGGILASMGLLGEYIGRMYMLINKTPQYVIRELKSQPAE